MLTTRATRRPIDSFSIPSLPMSLPQLNDTKDIQDILCLLPAIVGNFVNTPNDLQKQVCMVVGALTAHLPSRGGRSEALDAAVRCVAAGTREVWEKHTSQCERGFLRCRSTSSLKLYTPAVSVLRRALADPTESLAAETLLATLLLCCFDVRLDTYSPISVLFLTLNYQRHSRKTISRR